MIMIPWLIPAVGDRVPFLNKKIYNGQYIWKKFLTEKTDVSVKKVCNHFDEICCIFFSRLVDPGWNWQDPDLWKKKTDPNF